jgi:hypothetical protein
MCSLCFIHAYVVKISSAARRHKQTHWLRLKLNILPTVQERDATGDSMENKSWEPKIQNISSAAVTFL